MAYTENGKFKRDTKTRGNKQVTQIRVTGLSSNSKFKDNEEIVILSKEDFKELENQLSQSNSIIKDLENQLTEANFKIINLENDNSSSGITSQRYYNELITAKDDISNLKDMIINRNNLLANTQDNINELLEELTSQITELYNTEITKANTETQLKIKAILDLVTETYTSLSNYLEELENQQREYNKNIDNSNFVTRALHKDSLKLKIDTSKIKSLENNLTNINQYCINYEGIVKPVQIPASKITEIKLNAKSKKFNIKELYIDTGKIDDTDNIIINPDTE